MQTELAYCMWFQNVEWIGDRTLFRLREHFGNMKEAFIAKELQLKTILNEKQFQSFLNAKKKISPKAYMEEVREKGIRYVPHFDVTFPDKLLHIPMAPFGIFVKGSLPDVSRPTVAMVGTRACSDYGKEVAAKFAQELACRGVQIVSGMARGIDAISQANCIKAGGYTYAVLGSGVDVCYPAEHRRLYEEIAKRGGIISTYPPESLPKAGCFPPRNRIISGLSDIVLVIEAGAKSGTLITVDMALEQGREVAVIPGRITDRLSQGCLQLVKQGASIVVDVQELMELLKGSSWFQGNVCENFQEKYKLDKSGIDFNKNTILNEHTKSVLSLLSKEPQDAEKLYELWCQKGGKGAFSFFMEILMDLELLDLCKSNKNRFSIR